LENVNTVELCILNPSETPVLNQTISQPGTLGIIYGHYEIYKEK
jgi:hypothetical protein